MLPSQISAASQASAAARQTVLVGCLRIGRARGDRPCPCTCRPRRTLPPPRGRRCSRGATVSLGQADRRCRSTSHPDRRGRPSPDCTPSPTAPRHSRAHEPAGTPGQNSSGSQQSPEPGAAHRRRRREHLGRAGPAGTPGQNSSGSQTSPEPGAAHRRVGWRRNPPDTDRRPCRSRPRPDRSVARPGAAHRTRRGHGIRRARRRPAYRCSSHPDRSCRRSPARHRVPTARHRIGRTRIVGAAAAHFVWIAHVAGAGAAHRPARRRCRSDTPCSSRRSFVRIAEIAGARVADERSPAARRRPGSRR